MNLKLTPFTTQYSSPDPFLQYHKRGTCARCRLRQFCTRDKNGVVS